MATGVIFMKHFLYSLVLAVVLTGVSYLVAFYAGWGLSNDLALEVFAVFTSYSCTYLCVKQSRWNYPIGMITTAAYAYLFYLNGLYSSAVLNAYLVPYLIYGWYRWGPDEDTRPVTHLAVDWWLPVYFGVTVGTYYILSSIASYMGASLAGWDAVILTGSILAQFMLDNKKLENWYVWAIVDIIAIYVYMDSGLYLVALQYVFFLGNTAWGYYDWRKTMRRTSLAFA